MNHDGINDVTGIYIISAPPPKSGGFQSDIESCLIRREL